MTNIEQIRSDIIGKFIWTFKKGDNILYNLKILDELYKSKSQAEYSKKCLYNKPIFLIIVSIVECVLEDFITRARQRTVDPLPNITPKQEAEYKTKKYDQFEHFIAVSKKHNLFDEVDTFYTQLDELRQARNRIHIQNNKNQLDPNEKKVFSISMVQIAQHTLERVIETMMTKFPRYGENPVEYDSSIFPWT